MIFGDKNKFAIELDVYRPRSAWLFGQICYWISNELLGDYEHSTSLRDYLLQAPGVIETEKRCSSEHLWEMDCGEAFRLIDASLYGNIGGESEKCDDAYRFDIQVPIDVFIGTKLYLIQFGAKEKLIFSRAPYTVIKSIVLPVNTIDILFREVIGFLESEAKMTIEE